MASGRLTDRQPDTVTPIYPLFFKGGIINIFVSFDYETVLHKPFTTNNTSAANNFENTNNNSTADTCNHMENLY